MGHRTKAKVYLKAWLINLNDRPRNQMKHYYSIENYKEKRLLNFIDTPKKTKVTDESRDSMNILKVASPNIKSNGRPNEILYCGTIESTCKLFCI